jgi:hypothetical protein
LRNPKCLAKTFQTRQHLFPACLAELQFCNISVLIRYYPAIYGANKGVLFLTSRKDIEKQYPPLSTASRLKYFDTCYTLMLFSVAIPTLSLIVRQIGRTARYASYSAYFGVGRHCVAMRMVCCFQNNSLFATVLIFQRQY